MTSLALTALLLASAPGPDRPCHVDDCLKRLRARVEIQLASVEAPGLAGHWTEGPGLSGGELYLFEDGTYISTEWGCFQPETIHDKGRFSLEASVLHLAPDADVTWNLQRGANRRYAVLNLDGDARLFGLDWSLEAFEDLAAEEPREWLEAVSLSQAGRWKDDEGRIRRAQLLKTAWQPTYYDSSDEQAGR